MKINRTRKTIAALAGTLLLSVVMVRCAGNGNTRPVAPEGLTNLAEVQATPSPSPATIEEGQIALSINEILREARQCNPNEEDCNREIGEALYEVLQGFDTLRVNRTIAAADAEALRKGRGTRNLDVVREWQRDLSNHYLYEVKHGVGENSLLLQQQYLERIAYAMLAESVILRGQLIQPIDIDPREVGCLLQKKVGVLPDNNCND